MPGSEHALHAFVEAGLDTTLPRAVAALFARADTEGHGPAGLSALIQPIRKPAL